MSQKYKLAFEQMQHVLARNPAAARAPFRAETRQVAGLHCEAKIRQFDLPIDEPPTLAGTDRGPNPVELILAALGTCQEITFKLYAEKMGIELNGVSVRVSGNIDLRGFFAVDGDVRPGFESIKAEVSLDSPASSDELSRLIAAVEDHCPVLDILANKTPIDVTVERAGLEHAGLDERVAA